MRTAARECGNHPATFAISVVNEIPPDIVRFVGKQRVEAFVDDLVRIAKAEFDNSRGAGFVYKPLIGERAPPLDYRKTSSAGLADPG